MDEQQGLRAIHEGRSVAPMGEIHVPSALTSTTLSTHTVGSDNHSVHSAPSDLFSMHSHSSINTNSSGFSEYSDMSADAFDNLEPNLNLTEEMLQKVLNEAHNTRTSPAPPDGVRIVSPDIHGLSLSSWGNCIISEAATIPGDAVSLQTLLPNMDSHPSDRPDEHLPRAVMYSDRPPPASAGMGSMAHHVQNPGAQVTRPGSGLGMERSPHSRPPVASSPHRHGHQQHPHHPPHPHQNPHLHDQRQQHYGHHSSAPMMDPHAMHPHGVRHSRKASDPNMDPIQQEEARKERNREIARRSRERKRLHLEKLEKRLRDLEALNANVHFEINFLNAETSKNQSTISDLQDKVMSARSENLRLRNYSTGVKA